MRARKITHFINKVLDIPVYLALLFSLFLGVYSIYDNYMVYKTAGDESLKRFKPGAESEEEKPTDMIAWLTLDETTIDYPVMQGLNNLEYLNKDPYGEYSMSGSIFLDSRNAPDFSDDYSLIYGHHMEHTMFGAIDFFLDKTYYEKHRTGTLTVGNKTYRLKTFAVVEALAEEDKIFNFKEGTLEYIKENAKIINKEDMPNGRYIGMSTCKFPDTTERTILFAVLEEESNTVRDSDAISGKSIK